MTSRSARISRLKRRRERLAAGIDEDDAVVLGLLDEISRERVRIEMHRDEVRRHLILQRARVDELRDIQDELRRLSRPD